MHVRLLTAATAGGYSGAHIMFFFPWTAQGAGEWLFSFIVEVPQSRINHPIRGVRVLAHVELVQGSPSSPPAADRKPGCVRVLRRTLNL